MRTNQLLQTTMFRNREFIFEIHRARVRSGLSISTLSTSKRNNCYKESPVCEEGTPG